MGSMTVELDDDALPLPYAVNLDPFAVHLHREIEIRGREGESLEEAEKALLQLATGDAFGMSSFENRPNLRDPSPPRIALEQLPVRRNLVGFGTFLMKLNPRVWMPTFPGRYLDEVAIGIPDCPESSC